MSRTRWVGGKITEKIGCDYIEYSKGNIVDNCTKKIIYTAEDGHKFLEPDKQPASKFPNFIDAWWSFNKNGENENIRRANLDDTVFFHVKTINIPIGTNINFKLFDMDKIIFDFLDPDDNDFNGETIEQTGTVEKFIGIDAKENDGIIHLKLYLNPKWESKLLEDGGNDLWMDVMWFHDNAIDLYWEWEYLHLYRTSNNVLLDVWAETRSLYLLPAHYDYNFPEVRSANGDLYVFLMNTKEQQGEDKEDDSDPFIDTKELGKTIVQEGGDVANDLDVDIDLKMKAKQLFSRFYVIEVKIKTRYSFESRNSITTVKRSIYSEYTNLSTGNQKKTFFIETEKVNLMYRSDMLTEFSETRVFTKRKFITDYFDIRDIGKAGWKGTQKALNVLGYIDFANDAYDIFIKGERATTYDTAGIAAGTTGIIADTSIAKALPGEVITTTTKGGSILEAGNAILFGIAIFEATVTKHAIQDLNEFLDEAMVIELENAKNKGLKKVKDFVGNDWGKEHYQLVSDISQIILDEILGGKIKMYDDVFISKKDNPIKSGENQYHLLFRYVENQTKERTDYYLETIL